jgi:hypothetical protein
MKIGTILTASDLNPMYMDFIPMFIKAWKHLLPESDVVIILVAESIPDVLKEYSEYIKLFIPIPGIITSLQAQCIRLLAPRNVERKNEGVLISDMDMIPTNRKYYVSNIENIPDTHFVTYREVLYPDEIAMCYNVATPDVWTSVFGNEDASILLKIWNEAYGSGWSTDQAVLVRAYDNFKGDKTMLLDKNTGYKRLDRIDTCTMDTTFTSLATRILREEFSDYHCLRPYREHKEKNDAILSYIINIPN